ncbi:MAG TPA: urea ABC transporter permease subunit UrtB [Patescibacteria group bacterium]|nr:urea ABC transporter permease subunit UrtB [Patescibacteria group bacterium]
MGETAVVAGQIFNGISVGSILLLAALGLALSFGVMKVINMAHGEMLMIGGYLAYLTCLYVHGPFAFLVAMPVGFIGGCLMGALLEFTIVRHLYGRPLDTLIVTWGISLILQQSARSIFGPIGDEVVAPSWLDQAIRIHHGFLEGVDIPYVRLFIIVVSLAVLGLVAFFITRTTWGMRLRAVHQNREMAAAMGINTRWIDLAVFSLGTGVAGLGGAVLALIAPVTPTVGQSYIVYAFLVVIVGGPGSLVGAALAALCVGLFSATTQIFTGVSLSDVLLLVAVVVFIQFRPTGIIAKRSRLLDDA